MPKNTPATTTPPAHATHSALSDLLTHQGETSHTPNATPSPIWQMLLADMKVGVVTCDLEHRIVLINPALEPMLDINNTHQGDSILSHWPEDAFARLVEKTLATQSTQSQTVNFYKGQLKYYYHADVIPLVVDHQPCGYAVMIHDESVIRRTEKLRRDFVANVSHELRTPLSAIYGYAETLLDGAIDNPDDARDFVDVIFRHAQRLSQLVTDLLDLSKFESLDFSLELLPVSLEHLLHKVCDLAQGTMTKKQLHFSVDIAKGLPKVNGHLTSLEQVLTNLLDNAIKYTPKQGHVSLKAFVNSDHMLEVQVSDTGIGIEAKHLPRLFERFYRVDKARSREMGGTGLGLSIVKHIVQLHHGDITVESVPHKGTTFTLTLPPVV